MTELRIESLTKSYGDLDVLRGLSLTVQPGEIYGFVGSNGAGKTTTMRIVLGVLSSDSGEVLIDGSPITFEDRQRIGHMPEERGLYPKMKVGEQLIYLAELHGMNPAEAKSAMEKWTEELGIAARRDDEVDKLSLGNQQRVQLAAALVHNSTVLVLDEPFSGLDPVAVNVMSDVLKARAAEAVPVIFSSHQLDLVERLCDRVGILKGGELVAEGTIDELRHTPTVDLAVRVENAAPSWADNIPGASLKSAEGSDYTITITTGDTDAEQAVLRAATAAGTLREFGPIKPRLQDIYTHIVTSEEVSA